MAVPRYSLLLLLLVVALLATPTAAFGAGNIASISKVEGTNWRHGDIEDMLKTVACLKGHKWSSMMIKRVYFGNWLRDYSQAVDVGTLKGVQADTIRILVWILAFMSFGYATGEFEVTTERLGVYRPEEHIDNPKDYADNLDARQYDARLRGPIQPQELAIDPNTGMKNYIANEYGGWATSSGYIKHSFARAIHFGRLYTHGPSRGREEDLCEALRCLGQGLHCIEDFGAHSNYTELALREMGFNNVFPHVGSATQMMLQGKHVFPLVTGTFGGVDFLHSVLGEATDHFTQSEIDEVNTALADAAGVSTSTTGKRSSGSHSAAQDNCTVLTDLLGKIPGTGGLVQEAVSLQKASQAQEALNHQSRSIGDDGYSGSRAAPNPYGAPAPNFNAPPGSEGGPPGPGIPGMNPNMDPSTIVPKIYPILAFRDKVVRAVSAVVSKIPGLEKVLDAITERVTIFVLSLLAPFIRPIIDAASKQLKIGSSAVVSASGTHQYEPWTDPHCTDPTHSLLSKDHFSNVLNEPAGRVATVIIQYVAPRVLYAMDHPNVPLQQVLDDVTHVFHHPALRDERNELHRNMFREVDRWARGRGNSLNDVLSADSVRAGRNHFGPLTPQGGHGHGHGHGHSHGSHSGSTSHSKVSGSVWSSLPSVSGGGGGYGRTRSIDAPEPYPGSYPADFAPYPSSGGGGGDPSVGPLSPVYDAAAAAQGAYQPPAGSYSYGDPTVSYSGGYGDGAAAAEGGGAYYAAGGYGYDDVGGAGGYTGTYEGHAPEAPSWQTGYSAGWNEQGGLGQGGQQGWEQDQGQQQQGGGGGGSGWFSS